APAQTLSRRVLYTYFFSSRRRHTRFKCDWSSDVCSSDLLARVRVGGGEEAVRRQRAQGKLLARERVERLLDPGTPFLEVGALARSEEHTSELQSHLNLVCRLLLETKKTCQRPAGARSRQS